MIRAGVTLFGVGTLCTLLALSPLVTGRELPGVMWFLAMLMGVGFLLVLFGMLGRARRRSALVRTASIGG